MKDRVAAGMSLRTGCPLWVALLLVLVVGPACAGASTTASPGGGSADVRDLSSIGTLQDRFDRDAGSTRLILLISPT